MLLVWLKKYWGNLLLIGFGLGGIVAAFYVANFFKHVETGIRSQKPIIFCQPQDASAQNQLCFYTSHIDIYLTIKIWGEERTLPFEKGDLTKAHTHADKNKVHWHSLIPVNPTTRELERQLILSEYIDDLGIPFADDRIYNFKNGDVGPNGKPGFLKMLVEGKPRNELRNFIIDNALFGQHIELVFDDKPL